MKEYLILGINPGSTSTKVTVFRGEECIFKDSISHSKEDVGAFPNIIAQKEFRRKTVLESLLRGGVDPSKVDAVVGRGGFLPEPLFGGTYIVDDNVCDALEFRATDQHAANLGAALAKSIADEYGKPAYIVDPVGVNETKELGKVSGYKGITRRTMFHCLNVKAVGRMTAKQLGKRYDELNLIITHMGGGVSTSAHEKGRAIDCTCGILGEGAFSPERAGTLGLKEMITLVLEESTAGTSREELERKLCGGGGIVSYLGTNDAREVEKMIEAGNREAALIYEAMAYQIAKDIAAMASVLKGDVDAIVLTAGLAYSGILTDWIRDRVGFIANVIVLPGEYEHEAMTLGALRVLTGEEEPLHYMG